MNIIDCLKHDHAQLCKLSKAMAKAEQPADAKAFYLQLRELLVAHSRAEEAVVYRALEKLGVEKLTAATNEGEVEHSLCDHLIDTMARGRADSVTWKARAMVVCELLEHHLDEEDEEMLPELAKRFDAGELEALGRRFEARKQRPARPKATIFTS